MSKYFCKVCNRDHKNDGFTIDYCDGCQMKHPHNRWKTVWGKEKYTLCGSHYRSHVPYEKKVDNYSPEEVMAGVPFGGSLKESGFRNESNKNWSEEQKEQVAWAEETLSF